MRHCYKCSYQDKYHITAVVTASQHCVTYTCVLDLPLLWCQKRAGKYDITHYWHWIVAASLKSFHWEIKMFGSYGIPVRNISPGYQMPWILAPAISIPKFVTLILWELKKSFPNGQQPLFTFSTPTIVIDCYFVLFALPETNYTYSTIKTLSISPRDPSLVDWNQKY